MFDHEVLLEIGGDAFFAHFVGVVVEAEVDYFEGFGAFGGGRVLLLGRLLDYLDFIHCVIHRLLSRSISTAFLPTINTRTLRLLPLTLPLLLLILLLLTARLRLIHLLLLILTTRHIIQELLFRHQISRSSRRRPRPQTRSHTFLLRHSQLMKMASNSSPFISFPCLLIDL